MGDVEEMARVARLAVRLRRLVAYVVTGLAYYVYALGVVAGYFTLQGLSPILGINGYSYTLGAFLGIAIATASVMLVSREAARVLGGEGVYVASLPIALALGILAAIAASIATPRASYLAWYPGLGGYLLGLGLTTRPREYRWPHLLSSTILLATTPLVYLLESNDLAIGLMSLAYFTAGPASVYRGLRG